MQLQPVPTVCSRNMCTLQSIHVTYDRYFSNLNGVWNLHASFEHGERDFRIPVHISLVYWRYELWIFLYITAFSISRITIVSQVFWIFFSVNASFSERFPEKSSTFHSNAGRYKEEFECSFHSWTYWSRITWINCKWQGQFKALRRYKH